MKIFLLSNMYPSSKNPSYGIFVKNVVDSLEKSGVEFSKISVIRGKSSGFLQKLRKYLFYYGGIFTHYFSGNFDLIYVHFLSHNTPILYLLFKFFGKKKKLVINVHGSDVIKSRGKKIDRYNKKILKVSDKIIVPSVYFKNLMLAQYPEVPEKLYYISPSGGIDPKLFYPVKTLPTHTAKPVLGFVSRIDNGKGWDIFLDALAILQSENFDFKAKIAGQGAHENLLKQKITDLHLQEKVDFLGVIDQKDLADLYQSFDLFVFPTMREAESLGLVGLEAMACGIPVIGSHISGVKTYLIDEVNGFFFPPGNADILAEKVKKYFNLSEDQKIKMKEQALQTAQSYDKEKVMKNLKNTLVELIKDNL